MLVLDNILDADEVAQLLRLHKRTVLRLANRGELPGFKIGDQWRFKRDDLEEYIEGQKRKQQQQKQ